MWSLRLNEKNEFYLTYDHFRRYSNSLRGIWELIGAADNAYTQFAVRVNESQGYLCCPDDKNGMRVLVLTE